jgi:hypothetical protein
LLQALADMQLEAVNNNHVIHKEFKIFVVKISDIVTLMAKEVAIELSRGTQLTSPETK